MASADDPFSDSPYDPQHFPDDSPTAPLDVVIQEAMHSASLGMRVGMPGAIVSVGGDQTADIQPLIQVRYRNEGAALSLPVLPSVPVIMPMGTSYSIRLPMSAGDTGWLLFADRSLAAWAASQGSSPVDPQDDRSHHLADAVFIPGLVVPAKQSSDGSTDLVLTAGQAQVRLTQTGTIKMLNKNSGQEMVDLVSQLAGQVAALAQAVALLTVGTGTGPSTVPVNVASFTSAQSQAQALQQQVGTLKG